MIPLGILLGLSSAVAFGFLDSLISIASRYISIVQTIVLAQAISVLVLLFYLVIFFKSVAIFSPAYLPLLLLVGGGLGIINTLANLSLYRGLALGPVAIISPIAASYGLVTTVLAVFVYHDVLSVLQCLAIGLVFGGIVLAVTDSKRFALPKLSEGILFGLGAMLGFGIEFFVLSAAATRLGPTQPLMWSRLCSVIFLLAYAWRKQVTGWRSIPLKHLAIILLIGLFDTAGMVWFDMGTSRSATSIVATLSSTYMLIPTLLGIIVYRERLVRLQWMGVCSIILGVVLLSIV